MSTLVLTNPVSRRNRRGFEEFAARASVAGCDHVVLGEVDSLDVLTHHWPAPGRLVINGGDGTVHQVFSAIHGAGIPFPEELLLLPGGTTNMTAHDLAGGRRGSARLLRDWADGPFKVVERVALEVTDLASGATQVGFFFGAGAIVAGIRFTHERVYRMGLGGEIAPALALGRVALGLLRREAGFMAGSGVRVRADAARDGPAGIELEHALVMLVTPLTRLFLGFRPWWGGPEHDGSQLRLTLVGGSAPGFVRHLPGLLRGRPGRAVLASSDYTSRAAGQLELDLEGPYTLDGELYPAPTAGLRLRTLGPARFLVPRTGAP